MLVLSSCAPAVLAAETQIEAPGGVAAETITNSPINIGIPPEKLPGIIEAATKDWRGLTDQQKQTIDVLQKHLGVNESALKAFFATLGEQDVPLDQVPTKLGEIAARHRAMLERWSVLDAGDPATAALAAEVKTAIDNGRYDEADALLLGAQEQDIAAASQAEQLVARCPASSGAALLARCGVGGKARRSRNGAPAL